MYYSEGCVWGDFLFYVGVVYNSPNPEMNNAVPISHANFAASNLGISRKPISKGVYQIGYVDEGLPTSCRISFPPSRVVAVKGRGKIIFATERVSVHEMLQNLEERVLESLHADSEHFLGKKRSREYIAKRYRSFKAVASKSDSKEIRFAVEVPIGSDGEYECITFNVDNGVVDIPAGKFAEFVKPDMVVRPIVKYYEVDLRGDKIEIRAGLFQLKLTESAFLDTRTDDEVAQRTVRVSHQSEREELERLTAEVKEKMAISSPIGSKSGSIAGSPIKGSPSGSASVSRSPSPKRKSKSRSSKAKYEPVYEEYTDSDSSDEDF